MVEITQNTAGEWAPLNLGSLLLLCNLPETGRRCCNKDMDQLSFRIFPTKHDPQKEQHGQGYSTIEFAQKLFLIPL